MPGYHASDSGSTVRVRIGARFCVELEENATAGYTWATPAVEGATVRFVSSEMVGPGPAAPAGAGGIRRFTFEVTVTGTSVIRIEYRRPWEREGVPARSFLMTVVATA